MLPSKSTGNVSAHDLIAASIGPTGLDFGAFFDSVLRGRFRIATFVILVGCYEPGWHRVLKPY